MCMIVVDDYRYSDTDNLPGTRTTLGDRDQGFSIYKAEQYAAKRKESLDNGQQRNSVTQGFASRFGSLSRRWKNRSAIGPPLSIITNTTPLASPRSSLDVSVNCPSRSASVKSNLNVQGIYSPASMQSFVDEPIPETEVVPIFMDQRLQSPDETEEFQNQATTPLLPPTMLSSKRDDSPIQSPLQSPAIAPTCYGSHVRLSVDTQPFAYLPSPPLSTRPSMTSMPRSRANTATQDIPALQLSNERFDPWAMKLGHADFSIYPEPYQPNIIDLDNYKDFRDNWDHARKQYAQHVARTIEHYGETSKVFKLTEEKWTSIDHQWKKYYDQLTLALSPQLARLSEGPASPDSPVTLLEKPLTRVVVPTLDKSGKFPELGDTDIVGPLTIGIAKVPELQRSNITPPLSPRRRNFIKALGDIFSRH